MAKGTKFLVLIGALIGIGAALLFFGSQAITSDIIIQEGQIIDGSPMQINAELDPKINTDVVFAVQTTEQTEVSLTATILDPNGNEIITNSIVTNSFEALFDITEFGTYTLLIDTSSVDSVQIIGGIGHVPDTSAYSISMVGFMLLLAGMVGVVIVGIIMVREKRKNTSS